MADVINLSGNAYVSATLKGEDELNLRKVKVSVERLCDHTKTICSQPECLESWQWDWNLYFHRTGGGRRLLARYQANKH